jgi:uncharacterized membrane protein YebE (DUF533 family)
MKSMFNSAPFARFDLGRHVLGQQTAFSITDYLSKVGLDSGDIDKIQDKEFRDKYREEYNKCNEKGLTTVDGLACLGALGVKVYAKLQEEETKPAAILVARPAASQFPWIPVTIGGVAAAGLVYYLATRGK